MRLLRSLVGRALISPSMCFMYYVQGFPLSSVGGAGKVHVSIFAEAEDPGIFYSVGLGRAQKTSVRSLIIDSRYVREFFESYNL